MMIEIDPLKWLERSEEAYHRWAELERLFGEHFDIEESNRRLEEILDAHVQRVRIFVCNYLDTFPEDQREYERKRLSEQLRTKMVEHLDDMGVLDDVTQHLQAQAVTSDE